MSIFGITAGHSSLLPPSRVRLSVASSCSHSRNAPVILSLHHLLGLIPIFSLLMLLPTPSFAQSSLSSLPDVWVGGGYGSFDGAINPPSPRKPGQIVPLGARLGGAFGSVEEIEGGEGEAPVKTSPETAAITSGAIEQEEDCLFEQELVGARAGPEAKAFFAKGSATSTFQEPAELTKKPCTNILNARVPKTTPDKGAESKRSKGKIEEAKQPEEKEEKELSKEEQILKDFGEPKLETPILAVDKDAPKPMQAMFAALEAGNDKLAFEYARQFARYMRNLRERSQRIAELTDIGQQLEGEKPLRPIPEGADYDSTKYLWEDALKREEKYRSVAKNLGPEVRELLERAESEEDQRVAEARQEGVDGVVPPSAKLDAGEDSDAATGDNSLTDSNSTPRVLDEESQRALIRQEFADKIPINPAGRLTVYFFVRSTETASFRMMGDFISVVEEFKDNPKIVFKALLANRGGDDDFLAVTRGLKGKVGIASGAEMARRLGIRRTPSVFFYIPGEEQTQIEEGIISKVRLSELVRLWSGTPIKAGEMSDYE